MKRIPTILTAAVVMAGCASPGKSATPTVPLACDEPGGGLTSTTIKYGNSTIFATPVTKIGKKKKWKIQLNGARGYEDAIVTITAKIPTDEYKWVSASGTESADNPLIICVPDTVTVGDKIYFMISIQGVGQLDPRADVVN